MPELEMICDIIPIFLAVRSGIKLCCTAETSQHGIIRICSTNLSCQQNKQFIGCNMHQAWLFDWIFLTNRNFHFHFLVSFEIIILEKIRYKFEIIYDHVFHVLWFWEIYYRISSDQPTNGTSKGSDLGHVNNILECCNGLWPFRWFMKIIQHFYLLTL